MDARQKETKGWVRGMVGGPPGLLVLIGPPAPGHAGTTSKVRYTSGTAGKCRLTRGRAAGHGEEERQRKAIADTFERKKKALFYT